MTQASTGFLYVSSSGTTGSGEIDVDATGYRVDQIRTHCSGPIAVGFGISSAEQVASVTRVADMAIVGTEMVRQIGARPEGGVERATACVRELRRKLG